MEAVYEKKTDSYSVSGSELMLRGDVIDNLNHMLDDFQTETGHSDIIIISAPLRDEFGTHLAQHFAEQSGAGILLLVKPEYYSDVSAQVTPCGVLTLQKPTSPQMMLQCIELLCGTRERLRRMEQKSLSMEDKMAEIRLINRAKWVLIEKQGMSEQDAHRYIEKQAMDRCVPKRVVAEEILR